MSKQWPYPRLIAHRGGGCLAPENTLAAMRCGANYGFDMVEFDVKLSKDNILILLHDDDVQRTSNRQGLAAEMTFEELSTLDMGQWHSAYYAGEPLPRLESIIRFNQENNIFCNIEIKPCPGREKITGKLVAEAVSAWFKNTSTPPLISSFSIASLEAFQKVAPEFALALLCDEYTPDIKKAAKKLACIAVNPDQSTLTEKLIKTIHKDGYKICAWTVNDYLRAKELLQWGCDAIFTDELERIPASMA